MPIQHLLSLRGLGGEQLERLAARSVDYANGRADGHTPLREKIVGIYFPCSSTRTRTSFTVGSLRLGAQTVLFGLGDLQLATGETFEDTGRVLAGYLDALVIRTNGPHAEMEALARQDEMAVLNAMSQAEHPTQAIADLATLHELTGGRLDHLHLLYLGEGNNSAAALAHAFSQLPSCRLTLITPPGYGLPEEIVAQASATAAANGSSIDQHHDMARLPDDVDFVYTTRWNTMGVEKQDPDWLSIFAPYTVTEEVMARASGRTEALFLHDLPAVRGEEVQAEVLDGPRSRAWRQARYKMWSAMAVLEWCLAS